MAIGNKLTPSFRDFISRQRVFFVATAAREGSVNVSPKGMDTLRILDDRRMLWLNLSGSGNETAAHLRDTPRMTLMFCALEGDPLILRVYGTARTLHPRDADWSEHSQRFPQLAGSRQIFDLTIDRVQTSCGTGVPQMRFVEDRGDKVLVPFFDDMGEDGVRDYWRRKNMTSIDGAPTDILADEA